MSVPCRPAVQTSTATAPTPLSDEYRRVPPLLPSALRLHADPDARDGPTAGRSAAPVRCYNRRVRLSLMGMVALLLALAPTASSTRSGAAVTVTIRRASCAVSPLAIEAGAVVFRIANRSARSASFSVAGRRRSVAAGRAARLTVSLRPGRLAYSCKVADRQVGGGFLSVRTTPPAAVEHTVGVRTVAGVGELYNRATGAKFVPRGSNYIRLGFQTNASGEAQFYHSTFNVGRYDSGRAEAALSRMAADGYNAVRVFLSEVCIDACVGDPSTASLRAAYIANLVDFLRRAKSHGVFVLLTNEWIPPYTTYANDLATARRDWFDDVNLLMLSPQGIAAQRHLWMDLVRALIRQDAPMDAILAYELWNEAVVVSDKPPFSLTTGRVTAANGQAYDMASASDRRRIIDDGFVFLIDEIRAAIRALDPTALVTMGFFHDTEPNAARRGDNRLVRTRAVIERSSADFVDIHPYADDELTFPQFMQNYGIDGPGPKPIVMGEFGGAKRNFVSASQAATAFSSWQRQSCAYGIGGWLLWTWDTDEQPDLWNALSGDGLIEQALAPKERPDPCA